MFAPASVARAAIRKANCFMSGCAGSPSLEWRPRWLCYSNSDQSHWPMQMVQPREFPVFAPSVEIVPANYFAPLDLEAIYGRSASLEVDLGCGDGSFLVEMAAANPGRNFLGIE